jgi:hypothetical protein
MGSRHSVAPRQPLAGRISGRRGAGAEAGSGKREALLWTDDDCVIRGHVSCILAQARILGGSLGTVNVGSDLKVEQPPLVSNGLKIKVEESVVISPPELPGPGRPRISNPKLGSHRERLGWAVTTVRAREFRTLTSNETQRWRSRSRGKSWAWETTSSESGGSTT